MKLFFETASQASVFLIMLPLGMLLAACVELTGMTGAGKPLWDILVVLLSGVLLGIGVVFLNDTTLRLYHLLAIVCGWILYRLGVQSFFTMVAKCIARMKNRMADSRKSGKQVE